MPAEAPAWTAIVFARAPLAGQVKTRLIPHLGAEAAAGLHRQLMTRTLERACAARGARVQLWIAGDTSDAFVQDLARRFEVPVFGQHGADLGERMARALARALSEADRCVLIGTDCPAQTPRDLEQAAHALQSNDVVLQPAHDGGYVLVGLTRPQPRLFDAIAWGGPEVARQTLRQAASLGLRLHRLRPLHDLDSEADLRRALDSGWIDPWTTP